MNTEVILSDLVDATTKHTIRACLTMIRPCDTIEQAIEQLEQFLAMNKEVL